MLQVQRKFSISPKLDLTEAYPQQFTVNNIYPVIAVKTEDDEDELLTQVLICDDRDTFQWIEMDLCWCHSIND